MARNELKANDRAARLASQLAAGFPIAHQKVIFPPHFLIGRGKVETERVRELPAEPCRWFLPLRGRLGGCGRELASRRLAQQSAAPTQPPPEGEEQDAALDRLESN